MKKGIETWKTRKKGSKKEMRRKEENKNN